MVKKKIGYAYVVADLLHVGHIVFLAQCRDKCDELHVGVLTDEACMKKKPRPTIPFDERQNLIGTIKYVDSVWTQKKYSPLDNIKDLKPDIYFESDSHAEYPAEEYVKDYGGKMVIIPYFKAQSTTAIKKAIYERFNNSDKDI